MVFVVIFLIFVVVFIVFGIIIFFEKYCFLVEFRKLLGLRFNFLFGNVWEFLIYFEG